MGGTDDKVEVILRENIGMQRCQMRLEPQLDAVAHADLIPVLFLHGEKRMTCSSAGLTGTLPGCPG